MSKHAIAAVLCVQAIVFCIVGRNYFTPEHPPMQAFRFDNARDDEHEWRHPEAGRWQPVSN